MPVLVKSSTKYHLALGQTYVLGLANVKNLVTSLWHPSLAMDDTAAVDTLLCIALNGQSYGFNLKKVNRIWNIKNKQSDIKFSSA